MLSAGVRPLDGHRQGHGEHGARPVGAVAGGDACRPSPRRSRGRSPVRARCRRAGGRRRPRGRTCRTHAPGPPAGCPGLRPAPAADHAPVIAPRAFTVISEPAGAYLPALSSRLNSTCSNSTTSSVQHRQVAAPARPVSGAPPGSCRRAAAPRRSRPTDPPGRCAAAAAPDSSRVMSSRLPMKRLSRSASSLDGADQIAPGSSHRASCAAGWSPTPGSTPAACAGRARSR